MKHRRSILSLVGAGTIAVGAMPLPVARSDAGIPSDAGSAGAAAVAEIPIAAGRTTTLRVEPNVGRPLEREPDLVAKVPSLKRAIELDRDQRWAEAAALYQQALGEIGLAARFASSSLMERAAYKVELERRRSRVLAQAVESEHADEPGRVGPRGSSASLPMTALERARLLRLKLMAVRSATGVVSAGLVSATLSAFGQALHRSEASGGRAAEPGRASRGDEDNPEIRLLLCATRAIAGDRASARLELAHVRLADRTDPGHALAMALCQAALGYRDDALASLAVAVYRLGPSPRFLPGQTRELESSNDWDIFRADPRFERLFR